MPTTYKTPGVYVEEISLFPPSVAQVDTAVPAFIGYTEFANMNGDDLTLKPTAVTSLTEYNSWFGAGPVNSFDVYLDASNNITQVVPGEFYYMYESLRLFYDNGGGLCYIVSVGTYTVGGVPVVADLKNGLTTLEKETEPTLIVSPDAPLCAGATDLYDFQQAAILQCTKIGNRFVVCDLLPSDEKSSTGGTLAERVQDFRNQIGINNLKYAAAYVPYLYSALARTITFREITFYSGAPPPTAGAVIPLETLTSDNGIIQLIYDLGNAKAATDSLNALIPTLATPALTFEDEFKTLFGNYTTAITDAAKLIALNAITALIDKIFANISTFQTGLVTPVLTAPNPASKTSSKAFVLKTDINGLILSTGVKDAFILLIKNHHALFNSSATAGSLFAESPTGATNLNSTLTFLGINPADFGTVTLSDPALDLAYSGLASDPLAHDKARTALGAAYTGVINFFYAIQLAAASYETTLDSGLSNGFALYKNFLAKIALSTSQVPPSGAVVGIYAAIDDLRGVWKSPANVSINSIVGPVTAIDNTFHDDLNVDTNAGKSINAIRAYTGKGTLIYGGRTLAGNDNEWRYVSVRRTFNMVEESVKRASGLFVFEPNDANTWVKVKGMIENFLVNLWRQGALVGAKPEQAFYVKVGLGVTMISTDVLEGRMIVECGLAVVRPAEFIILKFAQKMQEA